MQLASSAPPRSLPEMVYRCFTSIFLILSQNPDTYNERTRGKAPRPTRAERPHEPKSPLGYGSGSRASGRVSLDALRESKDSVVKKVYFQVVIVNKALLINGATLAIIRITMP